MLRFKLFVSFILIIIILLMAACSGDQPIDPDIQSPDPPNSSQIEVIRIEPGSFAELEGEWADFLFKMRMKIEGQGALGIAFHAGGESGTYILLIEQAGFFLQKELDGSLTEIAASEPGLQNLEYHPFELEMIGGEIRLFYNEEMVIEHYDPDPIQQGGISFESMGNLIVELDHILIETVGETAAQQEEPEPTILPQEEIETNEVPDQMPESEWKWVRLGGPPGGTGYDIRYNFNDPNIWYATDANSGVHMSTDNGLTWEDINTGLPGLSGPTGDAIGIFCLTVDPHDPQTIWIGTIGHGHIYRSVDGGMSWEARENGIEVEYDQLTFRGFTVDPRTSDIVYAMAETNLESIGGPSTWMGGVGGVIYKTTDAGENWVKIWDGGMPSSLTRYMWINPDNPDILYVSTGIFDRSAVGEETNPDDPFGGLGILKSIDGGETWIILDKDNGLRNLYIGSLYMHPNDPDVLLAAASHGGGPTAADYLDNLRAEGQQSPMGIYRTEDGGETWVQTLAAYENEVFSSVELCPTDPNIGYAATRLSMYITKDAGLTWELTARPWSPPGISAGFPIDMQCDPRNEDRVFVNNYGGGNYLSEDAGKTWASASDGYTGAQIFDLAFDPTNPARVYVLTFSSLWRSDDAGATWQGIRFGPDGFEAYRLIAVDPDDVDHVFTGQYGFIESFDAGSSWNLTWDLTTWTEADYSLDKAMGGIPTFAFAPSDPNRVYVGFSHELCALNHEPGCMMEYSYEGPVLIASSNGGTTWTQAADSNLAGRDVRSVAVDPSNPDIVYAATDIGIFKTSNSSETWNELSSPKKNASVYAVSIDPTNPDLLLISLDRDGVYKSTDGGQTWKNSSAGMEPNGSVSQIMFDPSNPSIVYASDFLSGVYRSKDSGSTWKQINNGLQSRAISSILVSADGNHIYAGSNEDGLYRLDLNGIPPASNK